MTLEEKKEYLLILYTTYNHRYGITKVKECIDEMSLEHIEHDIKILEKINNF